MIVLSIKKYIKEVIEEGKKIIFPSRKDVYTTSLYITVVVVMAAACIALADFTISQVIKLIFGMGN